jgi:signal transduction histidine kinase
MGVLPQQLEIISYRLVQECFNNIGKHSSATNVNISLASADGRLRLIVEDNGVGFNVQEALAKRESFGLSGMRERVALLGGEFHVESRTDGSKKGTKISIELPIAK